MHLITEISFAYNALSWVSHYVLQPPSLDGHYLALLPMFLNSPRKKIKWNHPVGFK